MITKHQLEKFNLADEYRFVPTTAAQIYLTSHVTFAEKMPTVPKNSTEQPGGELGDDLHNDFN